MLKDELRPIGTEFWYEFPPDLTTTAHDNTSKFLYRIVGHSKVRDYRGITWTEELEPIDVVRFHTS